MHRQSPCASSCAGRGPRGLLAELEELAVGELGVDVVLEHASPSTAASPAMLMMMTTGDEQDDHDDDGAGTMPPSNHVDPSANHRRRGPAWIGRRSRLRPRTGARTVSAEVGPGLDLDQGDEGQLGDGEGRSSRVGLGEELGVDLVHERVVAHVAQEHRGLAHVGERGALAARAAPSCWRWPGGARPARRRPPSRRPTSPIWPDTISQSPARTIGRVGRRARGRHRGLLDGRRESPVGSAGVAGRGRAGSLGRGRLSAAAGCRVGQSGGRPWDARPRPPPPRTPRRSR